MANTNAPAPNPLAAANSNIRSSSERQRTEKPRERARNLGGPRLKLSVAGTIDGYHLYWENDDSGAIEQLLSEGFDFVKPAEVRMTSHIVADADLADRISRYVGKKDDGTPMRAFLLKCPNDVWAERENDRLAQADAWDAAIRAGKVQHDSGRYVPKGVETSLDTQYRKEY